MKRQTPYHNRIVASAKETASFLDFTVPIVFEDAEEEHHTTRNAVGVFDVLYQVVVMVAGPDAEDLLRHVLVNDVAKLACGRSLYSSLCNEKGGIIDDLIAMKREDDVFWLCPTPTRVDVVVEWLNRQRGRRCAQILNLGYKYAYLSVQGPNSSMTLAKLTQSDITDRSLRYFGSVEAVVADVPGTVISRTGYSGELGFELFYPSEYGEHMWDSVLEAGAEFGIKPCGIAALRSLRIEKKYPSYGSDIDEDTTPIEAGLEWTVKLNGRDFVGERVLANQLRDGTSRKLVLLESPGRHKILPGAEILHSSEILSTVRSSGIGYTMGNTYALAYLPVQFAKEDQDLHIMTSDGGKLNAKVHFNAPYDPDLKRMKL